MIRMLTALGLTLGVAWGAQAQDLGVGDPAPKLVVKEFVKGEPVRAFEPGKTYVVEFWATWCGPCRVSIPHLTELQKKYKDVTFIGVSVWEDDPKEVKPFVKGMGDKMDYRVATDAIPDGGKPTDGTMAHTWMEEAGEEGIPAAFIINGEGKVAWIGHPMTMDEPLEKIVAGTYDLKAAVAERKAAIEREKALEELQAKLAKADEADDVKGMIALLDEAIKADPVLEPQLGTEKLGLLLERAKDPKKALEYGKYLVDVVLKEDADGLNEVAWLIVDPEAEHKPDAKLIELALGAAQKADKLEKGENPYIADTLAKALYDSGDPIAALAAQERAVRLAQGTQLEDDEGIYERLEMYRKAIKKSVK
jgi:thiol-disulfide isomerase/thioredoxin